MRRPLIIQVMLFAMGIATSLVLMLRGNLMEAPFGILFSPFVGLLAQVEWVLLVQPLSILILIAGIVSFALFVLFPGLILSYLIYPHLLIYTRVLIGTFLTLILIYFPTTVFLLLGIPPPFFLLGGPISLSLAMILFRPALLGQLQRDVIKWLSWLRHDVTDRSHAWFWMAVSFLVLTRLALFSFTDSYSSDSAAYVDYSRAIGMGIFLRGYEIVHPPGYPLLCMPFVWMSGGPTWGLAVASWVLASIALFGAVPLVDRLRRNWPTTRKPPLRVLVLTVLSVPWLTILMSSILSESTLLFLTLVGACSVGERLTHREALLGLASGLAYLVRPTHALMFISFMIWPLWENRGSAVMFVKTGLRSLTVVLPVAPRLIRNLLVKGVLLDEPDLQFFGMHNVVPVARVIVSFVINSDYGFFPLLFLFPLLWVLPGVVRRIGKLSSEILSWILFCVLSTTTFLLWPTLQPRFFAFMIWMVPTVLVLEAWQREWYLVVYSLIGWMLLIVGAIQYSSTGWLIDMSSSHLTLVPGIVREYPDPLLLMAAPLGLVALLILLSYDVGWSSRPSRLSVDSPVPER